MATIEIEEIVTTLSAYEEAESMASLEEIGMIAVIDGQKCPRLERAIVVITLRNVTRKKRKKASKYREPFAIFFSNIA